jgi:hypothetical protein
MTSKTSRRAVLAGAAALPALSLPALAITAQVDPVFALIEHHRQLWAIDSAVRHAHNELEGRLLDLHENIYNAKVPTTPIREIIDSGGWKGDVFEYRMTNAGPTGKYDYARNAEEITKAAKEIPREHRADWIADRRAALAKEKRRLRKLRIDSGLEASERHRDATSLTEYEAGRKLLVTVPTTLAGAQALIAYILEGKPNEGNWLLPDIDDNTIFLRTLSAALALHVGLAVQS